jgi:hypothetical protein
MVSLKVYLPRGSGIRTVEISQETTATEATAKLVEVMHVEGGRWKLYARPEGGATKALTANEKLTPTANVSYYFYPLP